MNDPELQAALKEANPRYTVKVTEGVVTISGPRTSAERRAPRVLNFSPLTESTHVLLQVDDDVLLAALPKNVDLELEIATHRLRLDIDGADTLGRLIVPDARDLTVSCTEGAAVQLEVRSGSLTVGDGGQVHLTVATQAETGLVSLSGDVRSVSLGGRLTLATDTHIGSLAVKPGEESYLGIDHTASIDKISGPAGRPAVLRIGRPPGEPRGVPKDVAIITEEVVNLELTGRGTLRTDYAYHCHFSGRELALDLRGLAEGIGFTKAKISLGSSTVIAAGISGDPTLGDLNGGTLIGDPKRGFLIHTVVASSSARSDPLADALIEHVKLRPGVPGMKTIVSAGAARRIEPHVADMAGWDLRLAGLDFRARSIRGRLSTRPPTEHDKRREVSYDADQMRLYSELLREKGASGSATTKVSWCAQRLRHQITRGKWEQIALWGYRLLGYGERPGPAFLTWVVASFLLTGVLAAQRGPQFDAAGVANFLDLLITDAVSPIGAIVRTGSTTSDDAWVYLVRAIVAVPLIVGVLALRKYTRAGGPE